MANHANRCPAGLSHIGPKFRSLSPQHFQRTTYFIEFQPTCQTYIVNDQARISDTQSRLFVLPLNEPLVDAMHGEQTHSGFESADIVSGAGHDAVYINRVAPAGMLFIP